MAYKQDTHSIKNSPAIALLCALPDLRFRAHDPAAKIPEEDFTNVAIAPDPLSALDGADALLIMTPWNLYASISGAEIKTRLKGRLVIDPHAILDEKSCRASGLFYHRLGC